jgi:hypothetical protein
MIPSGTLFLKTASSDSWEDYKTGYDKYGFTFNKTSPLFMR